MITICDASFYWKLQDKNCTKLIAIVDKNFGVSKNGGVPWAFDDDLKFFKAMTENSTIIMGRKTFFSIPNAPLKNRVNCVISRTLKKLKGAFVFDSLEKALAQRKNAWVIGGAAIYNYALKNNLIDYVLITQVNKNQNADSFIESSFLESFNRKILAEHKNIYSVTSYLRV